MSMLLPLLMLPAAWARGESADIELVRPTFSDGPALGVDTPFIESAGVIRAGTLLQYERDPLLLYEYGTESGTVISHRLALHLGVAADLGYGASARIVLPLASQWGSDVPALASDGAAVGDLRGGLRFVPPLPGPFRAGLRVDIAVPTGTREAWMGESTPRLHPGLLLGLSRGALQVAAEAGVEARAAVDTGQDFTLGTEAVGGLSLRWHAWPEVAAVSAAVLGRAGLADLASGGAESPAELLTGVQLWPQQGVQVDLGIGKGLTEGYGTTELRFLAGLSFIRRPPPPPPAPLRLVQIDELQAIEDALPPPPPPPAPDWDDGELARVEQDRIVIRQPIRFVYATDDIEPDSLPILQQVAAVLQQDGSIGQIVIEGHASAEGSFTYNYELSILRARAIWEALADLGVHPLRMSYRGMGEVMPLAGVDGEGADEAALARNRRVEFHIVQWRAAGDPPLATGSYALPWSGEPRDAITPPDPPPAEPPAGAAGGDDSDDEEDEL